MKQLIKILLTSIFFIKASFPVFTVELSGKNFNDWTAFSCFMASQAIKMEAFKDGERLSSVNRDIGRLYVTKNRANSNKFESTYFAGYPLKAGSQATIKIDNKVSFVLFAHPKPSDSKEKSYAWAHPNKDIALIDALKRGNKAVVEARSHTNKITKDSFSLTGFSKSLEMLKKSCK